MALGQIGRRSRQGTVTPRLQITAMMDMFTIIMIFLLVSFSSTPETLQLDQSLELPKSAAKLDYTKNIKLVMTQTSLQLEGEVVATLDGETIQGLDSHKPQSSSLYQRLKEYREKADAEAAAETGPDEVQNHLLFLCDRRHSFKTINSIIKTAGMAGYPNLQFAVLEK
ncbi:MAG: hypothetical protein C0617_11540 [Desulfuromonas sp.]|uniref:ExbD/TolR family protein n=1 Tax=Desulfuromonas sp. TaxID=892 RepID=UPI000CB29E07|nr:biopolymer transporter ExbD [Desulfuromonas sp.]PLX83166.1 MAG: hypothetical protein C0617_11540 [Desulfuromonas sp.]